MLSHQRSRQLHKFTYSLYLPLARLCVGGRAEWKAVLDKFWGPFKSQVEQVTSVPRSDVYSCLDTCLPDCLFTGRTASAGASATHAAGTQAGIEPGASGVVRGGDMPVVSVAGKAAQQKQERLANKLTWSLPLEIGIPSPDPSGNISSSSSTDSLPAATNGHAAVDASSAVKNARTCPRCGTGRLQLKASRTGSLIGCSNYNHPDQPCTYVRPLTADAPQAMGSADALGEGLLVRLHAYRVGRSKCHKNVKVPLSCCLGAVCHTITCSCSCTFST